MSFVISFEQEGFDSKYDVHESYNQNNEYSFVSILELPTVDVTYVGYYYCVKNATVEANLDTLVDTGQASNIYLFVEGIPKKKHFLNAKTWPFVKSNRLFLITDPQNPLVPVANPFLNGAQYQDITIPCKPSSKMWDIQLIKEGDEVKSFLSLANLMIDDDDEVHITAWIRSLFVVRIQSYYTIINWLTRVRVCHQSTPLLWPWLSSLSSSPKCLNVLQALWVSFVGIACSILLKMCNQINPNTLYIEPA